jgi:PAS domain S-box-containing protein
VNRRRWRLEPGVAVALACAGALILAVGLAAVREQQLTLEAGDWARHTVRVLEQISVLRQTATEAESAQRGYVLTGDRAYLKPYDKAVATMPRELDVLRSLTADNPSQQERWEQLAPILAAKSEELRLVISQRKGGDASAARDTIRSGLGKEYMARINGILAAAAGEERQLLQARRQARTARARRATWLILAASMTALLLMSLAATILTALLRRARAAERALRDSEERLRVTLRSIGDAVIATDIRGNIVFMNPVAEALTGWREADARGHPLDVVFRIVNADTRAQVENPAIRVLRDGIVVGLANHTVLIARDGREIQIDDSGAPIREAGGELMGVVLVFRDVSEREAAEAEHRRAVWADAARVEAERVAGALAEARAEAERSNEAKDAFLAILSHELRSPLSAMLAWVGILEKRGEDAATRGRAVAVLERSVRAQTQLINDLLDVSRIVSGKLQLERQPVDLAAELPDNLDGLQPLADAKGVQLGRELSPGPFVVIGDESRLGQVVRNLVENAVKFTAAGGRVTVRLARDNRHVELTVTDTGEGFPSEQHAVIFDRFRQSRTPLTRRHGGLGLGLAIVRHLVEEHGGTVRAASPGPGRGATFVMRLPLADVLIAPRGPVSRSDEATVDLRGVSILLVEDDTDWREAVALRLAQAGAEVTAAGTVAEALALLEETQPQVLVSDIGMPGADGYTLIRQVRARPGASLHAVAMTGFADPASRERCLQDGFDAFLAKPFEPGRLLVTVSELIRVGRQA